MTVKKYYIKKDGVEYPLNNFEYKKVGSSEIDTTKMTLSRTHKDLFSIGDDVSIGYHDELDAFVADFNGDIVKEASHEELALTMESYAGRIWRTEYLTEVHISKTLEWIVEWLITTYTTLTYAGTASTGITLDRFVINNETVGEAIVRIMKDLDWQIRVDNDKNFYFEPKGATAASVSLVLGTNAFMESNWMENPNRLANSCTVIGDKAKFNTNETTASAAVAQTEFVVTYKITGNVRVTVDGTEKIGGQSGSTGTFDYSVDKEQKTITFQAAMSGGEAVVIYYEYELPIKIRARNEASIASYGVFPKKITDDTLKTTNDARKLAKKIVSVLGTPARSGGLLVNWDENIDVGETVQVVDTFNSIDETFVVVNSVRKYPEGSKKIFVGTEEINIFDINKDLNDRIKKLESKQDNSDIVQRYITSTENINTKVTPGRRRTRTRSVAGDTLIWNNTDFGTWNSFKWGSSAQTSFVLGHSVAGVLGTSKLGSQASSYVVTSVTNPNKIMEERFNFSTYNDTATTSGATIDTTNEVVNFLSGALFQSLGVAVNDGTIVDATLTSTEVSGAYAYAMSADGGSNFESVTSGILHTFTNSGVDLRWKATEVSGATGQISNVQIDYS